MNDSYWELRQWLTNEELEAMWTEQESARIESRCNHADGAIIVYKVDKSGKRRFHKQCKNCLDTKMVARKKLTRNQINNATEYNEEAVRQKRDDSRNKLLSLYEEIESQYLYIVQSRKHDRRKRYEIYLQSDEWKAKRALVLKRCGGICEGCGIRNAEQIHHKTYDRLFDEMLFDLVGICGVCHRKIHAQQNNTQVTT